MWCPTPGPTNLSHLCPPLQILRTNMKEELAGLKSSYTISDLVRTPVIRHIFCCLSIVWWGEAGRGESGAGRRRRKREGWGEVGGRVLDGWKVEMGGWRRVVG